MKRKEQHEFHPLKINSETILNHSWTVKLKPTHYFGTNKQLTDMGLRFQIVLTF